MLSTTNEAVACSTKNESCQGSQTLKWLGHIQNVTVSLAPTCKKCFVYSKFLKVIVFLKVAQVSLQVSYCTANTVRVVSPEKIGYCRSV